MIMSWMQTLWPEEKGIVGWFVDASNLFVTEEDLFATGNCQ